MQKNIVIGIIGFLILGLSFSVGCPALPDAPPNERQKDGGTQTDKTMLQDKKNQMDQKKSEQKPERKIEADTKKLEPIIEEFPTDNRQKENLREGNIPDTTHETKPVHEMIVPEQAQDSQMGDTSDPLTCRERLEKSQNLIKTARKGNDTCSVTTDCTEVSIATGCRGACSVAINNKGASLVKIAIDKVNQNDCSTFRKDGCPYATPKCLSGRHSVCYQQKCSYQTCTDRLKKSQESIAALIKANLSCKTSKDCTGAYVGTGCRGACQKPVNQAGAQLLKTLIKNINSGLCYNFQKNGCPYATPRCLPLKIACIGGQCQRQATRP